VGPNAGIEGAEEARLPAETSEPKPAAPRCAGCGKEKMPVRSTRATPSSHHILLKKLYVSHFIELTGRQVDDGLGGLFFGCLEVVSVDLQKKDADNKADAFVAIKEGMILDDSRSVGGRHRNQVELVSIGELLFGPRQGGGQESRVAKATGAAMQPQQFRMERPGVTFVDPDWLLHFANTCNVLR